MKKILIVMDSINYKGGAHFATFKLANFLSELQYEISIYSPDVCNMETKENIYNDVMLYNEKKFEGYDCIIVPFENSIFREEVAALKDPIKIQWIHIEYEKWQRIVGVDNDVQRKIFDKFDKLVFVSKNNKESFLNVFPEFTDKCHVVYNFLESNKIQMLSQELVDEELMAKHSIQELNIVVSGRLEPQKAYHRLIDAVKILNEEGICINWYILGIGYEYEELRKKCQKYYIRNVHFLGFRENPYAYVKRADIFAVLSEYEGLALVVAESLTLGVPVISTETGGVREILSEDYGWIVNNDIYSIIDQIREIYEDRDTIIRKREALNSYTYNNLRIEESIKVLLNEDQRKIKMKSKEDIRLVGNSLTPVKVSVIVPVYNMENYLVECLESLVNQTLKDIEIIIVNDGSTDESLQIIEDYVYKYSQKVRAFTIENRGLGEARNYGISKARGTYLGFVDSDDAVRLDMFEIMYESAIRNNADCTLCDYIATWDTGKTEYVTSVPVKNPDRFDILRYSAKYGVVNICTKLVAREIFEHILFPKGFYEDLATVPILLSFSKKMYYIHEGLYFYRQRSGSITSIKSNDARLFDCYAAWDRILTMSNPLYKKEMTFAIYWSLNFFCTDFLDDFIIYSKSYYEKNQKVLENNSYISAAIKSKEFMDFSCLPQIPKIIHFCWFGNGEKSGLIKSCIESWKKFAPDFEIMEWNEDNCDVNENTYVKRAYADKKWAFVSDYFRLKALYEYGGVYLDTDMELMKPLELYLFAEAFFAFETPIFIHAGIIGAKKSNLFIKKIMDTYQREVFEIGENNMPLPIPRRITSLLESETNIVLNGKSQMLKNGIKLYSANIMTMNFHDGKCAANHHYEGNWLLKDKKSSYNYGHEVIKHYFTWDIIHQDNKNYTNINTIQNMQGIDYKLLYEQTISSTSWKLMKPLRKIVDCVKKISRNNN